MLMPSSQGVARRAGGVTRPPRPWVFTGSRTAPYIWNGPRLSSRLVNRPLFSPAGPGAPARRRSQPASGLRAGDGSPRGARPSGGPRRGPRLRRARDPPALARAGGRAGFVAALGGFPQADAGRFREPTPTTIAHCLVALAHLEAPGALEAFFDGRDWRGNPRLESHRGPGLRGARTRSRAGGAARVAARRALARRHLDFPLALDLDADDGANDLHRLFGAVSALAELQRVLPGELRSERLLRLVLDRRPFLRTTPTCVAPGLGAGSGRKLPLRSRGSGSRVSVRCAERRTRGSGSFAATRSSAGSASAARGPRSRSARVAEPAWSPPARIAPSAACSTVHALGGTLVARAARARRHPCAATVLQRRVAPVESDRRPEGQAGRSNGDRDELECRRVESDLLRVHPRRHHDPVAAAHLRAVGHERRMPSCSAPYWKPRWPVNQTPPSAWRAPNERVAPSGRHGRRRASEQRRRDSRRESPGEAVERPREEHRERRERELPQEVVRVPAIRVASVPQWPRPAPAGPRRRAGATPARRSRSRTGRAEPSGAAARRTR